MTTPWLGRRVGCRVKTLPYRTSLMTPLSGQHIMKCNSVQIRPKETSVSFPRRAPESPFVTMGAKVLEQISSAEILGVIVSSERLLGQPHTVHLPQSKPAGLHSLYMFRQPGASSIDLLDFYKSTIRSSVEYPCPFWHTRLIVEQSDSVKAIQKSSMKIIYPDMT